MPNRVQRVGVGCDSSEDLQICNHLNAGAQNKGVLCDLRGSSEHTSYEFQPGYSNYTPQRVYKLVFLLIIMDRLSKLISQHIHE